MTRPAIRHAPYSPPWRDVPTFVATVGGTGLLPRAPGTWGSLAALPLAWLILDGLGPLALCVAAILVFLLGWRVSVLVLRRTRDDDPGPIVIDEVAGQLTALIPATTELWQFALGFVLFRIADIVKPWPVSWADRDIEGGLGVMTDDILASLYALAGLLVAREVLA